MYIWLSFSFVSIIKNFIDEKKQQWKNIKQANAKQATTIRDKEREREREREEKKWSVSCLSWLFRMMSIGTIHMYSHMSIKISRLRKAKMA